MWYIHKSIVVTCSVHSTLSLYHMCVTVPFTELHEHAYTIIIAFVVVRMYIVYQQSMGILFGLHASALLSFMRYVNMHIPIVLCCGIKRVLFTNKLSEYWCHITIP